MKGPAILATLSLSAPVAGSLCGSAWPCAKQFTNLGARTGRARQNCCAQAKGPANVKPFAGGPRAGPAAGEAGTSGIHNVFRYAFNVPTGDFARPHAMSNE